MGIDPKTIPQAMLSKMGKADRKPMGKAGVTSEEAQAKQAVKREKELQDRCIALLRLRGIFVNWSRMDRKKTDRVGVPDLIFSYKPAGCAYGIPCAWECKLPGCHPTPEQVRVMGQMADNGWHTRIIFSEEQMKTCLNNLEANITP